MRSINVKSIINSGSVKAYFQKENVLLPLPALEGDEEGPPEHLGGGNAKSGRGFSTAPALAEIKTVRSFLSEKISRSPMATG